MTNRRIATLFFVWVVIYLLVMIGNPCLARLLIGTITSFCLLLLLPASLIVDLIVRFYEQPRKIPLQYYFLILTAISAPFVAMELFHVFGGNLSQMMACADS